MSKHPQKPITGVDELIQPFLAAGKPRDRWRVGAEHEKIGVLQENGLPVPYHGPRGIEALLERLVADGGWTPVHEGDSVIALSRDPLNVTLEPGGQLELSGAPHASVRDIEEEIDLHMADLRPASEALGIVWLGVGFRPFGTIDDVEWVPKGRYKVMRSYLPTRGRLAHEMMKRTATVQANLDFSDEDDCVRKMRCSMAASAVVTAMFANSPLVDGRDSGFQSYRARAWLETDPDRCGLLPFVFEHDDIFRRYTEWALDVPMFFVYRDRYIPAGGMTFRRFLRDGFQGERATMADWTLHLSTLFPEVRLKEYIEVRSADAGPLPMVLALPAFWKGLLYDDEALDEALALFASVSFDDHVALREAVPRAGFAAKVPGRGTVLDVARELCAIAKRGLCRISPAECALVAPLEEIVASGRSPADRVRDIFSAAKGDPIEVIRGLRHV